jgi:hypothetical protein
VAPTYDDVAAVRDQGIFLPLRANQSLASASLLAGSDGTR